MEFGLHETLPIYAGGLGVLSGDHLKEASDLGLPLRGGWFLLHEGLFLPAHHRRWLAGSRNVRHAFRRAAGHAGAG